MSDIHVSLDTLRAQNTRLASWVTKLAIWGALAPLTVGVLGFILKPVPPKYFRSTPDGKVIEMVPLDRPFLNQSQVLSFSNDCVYKSFGLDFHKWRNQITAARECFTEPGYVSYQQALEKSGNLARLEQDRLISTPYSTGPSVIASEGVKNGVYTWVVQQPISLAWENSGKRLEQRGIAEIIVTRVPTTERPAALAIDSINMRAGA